MLSRILIALSLFGFTSSVYAQQSGFAAIAISPSYVKLGVANDADTLEDAIDVARRDCGIRDCYIATYVETGCVAAAFSYPTAAHLQWYGFANSEIQDVAEREALRICEFNAGEYCTIAESFCTWDAPVQPHR